MVDELVSAAADDFVAAFDRSPTLAAMAPGRVNLMGDHTDYAGGLAMPCAVDMYTVAVAAPREDRGQETRLVSSQPHCAALTLPSQPETSPRGDWGDYLRGVRLGFDRLGAAAPAMDIALAGDLPLGAGLSSSASLELCYASLLEVAIGMTLNPRDKALLCQRAEHEFAGVPCGVLDQFAITFARAGHAMVLDCRSLEVQQIPLSRNVAWVIIDSRVTHDLADGEYARRREEVSAAATFLGVSLREASPGQLSALEPGLRARARHIVSENSRVTGFSEALGCGDWRTAGTLMLESHRSLAEDFAVSCAELDWLVARALDNGAFGARMTGGGFGGSVVCLCPEEAIGALREMAERDYAQAFGHGAVVRVIRPVDGTCAWHLEN